jgi:hypothetical protein
MEEFLQIHEKRKKHFESLYKYVTLNIKEFSGAVGQGLEQNEKEWISKLVEGFELRYKHWPENEQQYLKQLYTRTTDLFTLCSLAFLHIAKDLPLVIAENLDAQSSNEEMLRKEEIYTMLEEPLEKALKDNWKKPFMIKLLLWEPLQLEDGFMAWIVRLRTKAWLHGRKISVAPDKQVSTRLLAGKVLEVMKNQQKKGRFRFWSKIMGLKLPGSLFNWLVLGILSVFTFELAGIFSAIALFLTGRLFPEFISSMVNKKLFDGFETGLDFDLKDTDNT